LIAGAKNKNIITLHKWGHLCSAFGHRLLFGPQSNMAILGANNYNHCGRNGHDAEHCLASWDSIKEKHEKEKETKEKKFEGAKTLESTHFIVALCNISFNETFNTSWKNTWLLDIGATSHMNFRGDLFGDLNDKVDSIVYFANKSSLKPQGTGIIGLKLPGFLDLVLHDVLYLIGL